MPRSLKRTFSFQSSDSGDFPSAAAPTSGASGGSFPSWYPGSAGVIVDIAPSNTAADAANADGVGADSYPGGGGSVGLTAGFSGGCVVRIGGHPYLVIYGCGHTDGSYNGLIKFGPMDGNTPTWSVFLAASPTANVRDAETYSTDGRQAAHHTYNTLIGINDTVYSMDTDARYQLGQLGNSAFKFTQSGQSSLTGHTHTGNGGAAAYYNGKIYYTSGQGTFDGLFEYDVVGDTWNTVDGDPTMYGSNTYVMMAADTTLGGILGGGDSNDTPTPLDHLMYWKLPGFARTDGLPRPPNHVWSLIYDPGRGAFVSCEDGTKVVWELSASSLNAGGSPTWSSRTFTGATPSAAESAGTRGRFAYVSELNGYILVPKSTSSVYFYRST